MKKKLFVVLMSMCLVGSTLTGCAIDLGGGAKETEESEKDVDEEIELSESKVKLEVGEDVEVEIENFDDLSKVKVEIEDDDIAEIDFDDDGGTITVTGVSEGKTTVTVSAKDMDDASFKVTVEDNDSSASSGDNDVVVVTTEPNSGNDNDHDGGATVTVYSDDEMAGTYIGTIYMTKEAWMDALDDEETAEFVAKANLSFDITMELNDGGSATMTIDKASVMTGMLDYIDENYIEFACLIMGVDMYSLSDADKTELYDYKDEFMDAMRESASTEMDNESIYGSWVDEGSGYLSLTFEGETKTVVWYDGVFSLDLSGDISEQYGMNSSVTFIRQ